MKLMSFFLICLLIFSWGCSRKEKLDTEESIPQVSTVEADAVNQDLTSELDEQKSLMQDEPMLLEEKKDDIIVAQENLAPISEPVVATSTPELSIKEESPVEQEQNNNISFEGEIGTYTVEEGETLMMVAFKIYGDYGKWREIAQMNPKYKHGAPKGALLKFNAPKEKFVWNPSGEPYLIKKGDTLGTISNEKYGTPKKWKKLWDNNRPLVKNPNLIFAGFTLYYLPENGLTQL